MEPARRILIVDDEAQLLKMMRVYLQRLGYIVTVCDTTDDSMEDLALRILRANGGVRVLATSGYPVDMGILEAAAPGRVAFLHKPFPPERLADTLRRMLAAEKEV